MRKLQDRTRPISPADGSRHRRLGRAVLLPVLMIAALTAAPARADGGAGHTREAWREMSSRHGRGLLKSEAEIVRLAELTLAYGDQRAAAELLRTEMKAGRMKRTAKNIFRLADIWLLLREWDEARRYFRAPALMSPRAEIDFKISWTWFEQEDWKQAETYLRRALNKGGMDRPCRLRLLLGHTLAHRGTALTALEQYERAGPWTLCRMQGLHWAIYLKSSALSAGSAVLPSVIEHPVAGPALKACQTALFELYQDEAALESARNALMAAHALHLPRAVREGLNDPGSFAPPFLRVLARFHSGAEERAERDLTRTMEAGRRILDRERGPPTTALLGLLKSCAELQMHRADLLKRIRRYIAKAEQIAAKAEARQQ